MTAATMDVADLVKQMSENLEAIHAAVAGLSTTEHEAKLDELEQKRDTLLGDLKTEYDTEKEELAAKRKAEEEAVAEARRKEDEEREARRKAEDEEVRTRNESQDAERLGKFDEETKRVEDEADDGMDAVEAEVQKLLAEGEAKLKELEEKRKDINRMLEEKMSAPLPPVVPRKRARDKAAEAAAAAAAAVAVGAGVAAGVDAAADASADVPADLPADAAPTDAPVAADTAPDGGATADDAKPDDVAEAAPVEADAENKENSKSEVSSSPPFDLDEQGSNDAKAIDGTAAPASEEAEEGADTEADPGEVEETAEAVQEETTTEDTKEEEAEVSSKDGELKEEDAIAEAPPIEVLAEEAAADTDKAFEEEATTDLDAPLPAHEADDVVVARSLDEVSEPAPASTDDATSKDEPAEEIPNYYDTTSPTIPQNDTSPVPNDDFELSTATDEAAKETEEPISKDLIEETAAEEDAAPAEEEAVAAASVEPEAEGEAPATVEEPVTEEPAAETPEVAEGEVAVAEADSPTETVSEEAQPKSLEMGEPAPTAETDTIEAAEAEIADATDADTVVEPAAEVAEVPESTDLAIEEVVQSEDAPKPTVAEDTEDTTPADEPAEAPEPAISVLEASETVDDAEKDRSLDAEPAGDQVTSAEPEAAEPAVDKATEDVTVAEPTVEEIASKELPAEKAAVEDPASEEPAVEEAVTEQPIAKETASKELVIEELATSTSPIEAPVAEEPVVEDPTVEESAVNEETISEPIAKELPAEDLAANDPESAEPTVEDDAVEEFVAAEDAAVEDPKIAEAAATKEVALDDDEPAINAEASTVPTDIENLAIQAAASEEAEPIDTASTADMPAIDVAATKAVSDEASLTVEEAAQEQAIAAEAVVEAGEPETDEPVAETEPAADAPGEEDETVVEARALGLEAEEPVVASSPEAVPTEEASAEATPSDESPAAVQPATDMVEVTPLEDLTISKTTAAADEPSLEQPEAEDVLPSDEVIAATEPDVQATDKVATTIDPSDDEPLVAATASSDIAEVQAAPADDFPRDLDVDASEPAAIIETAEPDDDGDQASEIAKADSTDVEGPSDTPVYDEVVRDTDTELKSDELPVPQDDASLEAPIAERSFVLDASDDDDDDTAIPAEAAVAEPEVLDTPAVSEDVEHTTTEVLEVPAAPAVIEDKAQAIAADPFSDAAALTNSDAPVTEAEAIDASPATALDDKASSVVDDDPETAEDDAVSVLTVVEEPTVNVADANANTDKAPDAPAQLEDVDGAEAPLDSPTDTTHQPAIDVPVDVTALADDHSDAPAVEKSDESEDEAPAAAAAAAEDTNPDKSVVSEAAEASTLNDDDATEGDAAVPPADRELSPADAHDNTIDVTADRHDTPEPESDPVDGPVVAMASETAASPASPAPGISDDAEPIAAFPKDAEDDSDDDLLDIPIKPDTVDSQLTLVNGANTPIAIKSIEEPPMSPQSDAGSDAHDEDSFLGTRDGGASAEEAGLAFEKHHDTRDASPSPGEGEDQLPIAGRVQDATSDDGHDALDASIPATKNSDELAFDAGAPSIAAKAHIPFGDEVDSADDHLTDSEDESPFGLSVPGTQDRSLAASSFAASPEMHDDGEPGPEISFKNGDRAIVDDFAEASRRSTPSEYGEVGRSAPEGLSHMDMSAASAEEESIPSSPLIESPYDLDDFVEDVTTKHPLSPLPEEEDEDSNPFFADETSTLVGGHRALDDSPNQTFRVNMDEPQSPTQEDTQEDPFHLPYETGHQSSLAQHDEPFGEPHSAPNAVADKQPFDFRFDGEAPGHVADASAERDQVAVSGLGLNTFDRGVSHQEQDEFAQLVSQDNNPFRAPSRGTPEETTATRGNSDFGRPKTFDPWDRQKSPELVQRGFGQPSPGLNAPYLSTRSWTPAESPPVSPYRAASPDFKPWGTSSKPTSPALSQKWAPIGNNTDDQSSQSGWGGLPSARQQPALSFSPAPAFTPSTANTNLGYRRSEYSYEDDDDDASDYGKETKHDNRSSNGSLQDQFNGYRIKEQTIRVVDNHDAESTQSAVSTPRVCQPGPKLAPQSSSRDPLPSPLRLRHSVEGLPEPTSPNRNPFARPAPPRPQTPPSQAPEEDFDPAMFMPRDVTNVPWHARNDSAPVSLRSQSTLSSSPSSPVHSALHADKNEPVIRDSWPARPRNDSNLTDATGPDYDPFRHDTKTYQEPVIPVSQRWSANTSIPTTNNASPVRTANDSPGTMFQKMRSIFENQGQGSPTRGRAGTDSSSPTRSRPVSGVWVPVRQSRQFATGAQVWESAFGDGRGNTGQRDDPDERNSLLRGDDSH